MILGAVILALSLYLTQRQADKTHYRIPKLSPVVKADISKIEIANSGHSLKLEKTDRWRIAPQGYPADKSKIDPMLDVAKNLTLTAMVSESKNYNRYELDGDKKISVKMFSGNTLTRAFDIGKPSTSGRHTFVKLADDHRVYDARENFRRKFDHEMADLRDMTALSFDKNEIREIELEQNKKTTKLLKKTVTKEATEDSKDKTKTEPATETVWVLDDDKKTDASRVHSLINTLAKLRAEKYIEDKKKEDFKKPIYTVRLKGVKEYTLSIFALPDEESETYPAISSENDYPFELPLEKANDIMVSRGEIMGA